MMGQYHITVNLTKKEFLSPHKLGLGLKLLEQTWGQGSIGDVLIALLACSNGRGGGDFPDCEGIGRWAGDQIVVVGDYAEFSDIPGLPEQEGFESPWDYIFKEFANISEIGVVILRDCFEIEVSGDAWRERKAV
jgi:hypothetical protein